MLFFSIIKQLEKTPQKWLITGAAGFIGSNLVEFLLEHGQMVTGLDNFSTGYQRNLDEIKNKVTPSQWKNFRLIEGDIRELDICKSACQDIDYVLHQAALGSIPRSINDPISSNATNISGFLNMLVAAKDAKIKSFTYASSSSTYGDDQSLPKIEDCIGSPLSPYAITKFVNELYADVFSKVYQFNCIGLRYFNVFGPRQNKNGPYAAVIPKWITAMINNENIEIYGDGKTSRDFCYIDNVIKANILAATAPDETKNTIYNIALNQTTSLNQLYEYIKVALNKRGFIYSASSVYKNFREGDMRHSQACIDKAKRFLNYEPQIFIETGIEKTVDWFIEYVQ